MAIFTPGPLGCPKGKMDNIVFYQLKDQIISRSIGKFRGKPTPDQLANRQAMLATMDLLVPMKSFIKQGFEQSTKGTRCNAFNIATSYNKKNALKGEYPNINVDYTKVVLSSGKLPLATDLKLSKTEGGLLLEWNPEYTRENRDDLVMVALYHSSIKDATMYLNAGKREQGKCFIPIEENKHNLLNAPIEAYLCFKSANGELISDSVYLGNINGAAKDREEQAQDEQYTKVKDRFQKVEVAYKEQLELLQHKKIKSKLMKHLETEYLALKEKLASMPGKPV